MSQAITHTLQVRALNGSSIEIYDKTLAATFTQVATHHSIITVTKVAVDEEHIFPDITTAKSVVAVFKTDKDVTVKVGSASNDARTIKANAFVVIHDDSLGGKYYFSNTDTADPATIEAFVGEI